MDRFMKLFKFDPTSEGYVGVEREAFLVNERGVIQPRAEEVIRAAAGDSRFGYELSACQIESRTGPHHSNNLLNMLSKDEEALSGYLKKAARGKGSLSLSHAEVGPEDMPLDVYPDPSGRYQRITKKMPFHVLLAACRVIGTHIHIGMRDHKTALRVYNHVIKKCDLLCARGNGSFGERLDIYRTVAPDCDPKPYADWADFYRVACEKGFDKDPRKCWTLIRISKHGTIEFRMFGATSSLCRIVSWATYCHDLCLEVMG